MLSKNAYFCQMLPFMEFSDISFPFSSSYCSSIQPTSRVLTALLGLNALTSPEGLPPPTHGPRSPLQPNPGPSVPAPAMPQQCQSPAPHSSTHGSHQAGSLSLGKYLMPGAEAAPLPPHCPAPWQGGHVLPAPETLPHPDPREPPALMAPWHLFLVEQHHKVCFFFPFPNLFYEIHTETSYE